jgi:hypothetical protein
MSIPQDQLFDFALSPPQAERADLAFQLLQTLAPPGDEITEDELAAQIHERIAAFRRGELESLSREEARAIVQDRLSQERRK